MTTGLRTRWLIIFGTVTICLLALTLTTRGYEKFHGKGHDKTHGQVSSKKMYDSLYNAAVPLDDSPDGREIVDRCLEAYGGADHLGKIASVRQLWRMLPLMTKDSVDVVRTMAPTRKYKIFRPTPGGFEARMIHGDQAWFQSADTLIELNSGRYKAELFSYLILSMPLALKTEPFADMRYGKRTDDSRHYIYMEKSDSLVVAIGIDPETYYITRAEGIIHQDDQSFVFENHFGDHQIYDGYVFPQSLTNISMGLTVGQSVLKEVSVNSGLSDADFMPEMRGEY
jgi:hypothetical protein